MYVCMYVWVDGWMYVFGLMWTGPTLTRFHLYTSSQCGQAHFKRSTLKGHTVHRGMKPAWPRVKMVPALQKCKEDAPSVLVEGKHRQALAIALGFEHIQCHRHWELLNWI